MSQIEELREILVGGNAEEIAKLRDRINNLDQRTRDVSEVLAPAIDAGIKSSDELINSLTAPVSQSLKKAIRAEPDNYAEILYPVMAPAIRRSISQAISSLMVTINQTMASATSVEGLGLRVQAWRTGVPYAQLALRKSLQYQVEHVYLIDRESGMLVTEYAAAESGALDSDAVSAMFSAIQSFVQDSFSRSDEDRLTDLKVGGHTVWVAHGRKLMLACVIDGDPPERLKSEMYDTLDGIRSNFANAIEEFSGDNSAFEGVEERLQPLLQTQVKESQDLADDADRSMASTLKSTILVAVLAALAAYLIYGWVTDETKRQTVEHYLMQTPGVAVTKTYWDDDMIVVEGLQDPDAEIPYATFKAHRIEPAQLALRTVPFRSLETAMERQRFAKELAPPVPLEFTIDAGQIRLAGEAPITWLLAHDTRLRQLATDNRLQISQLRASESSVQDYIISNFASSEPASQTRLLKSLINKPWLEVTTDSLSQTP